jgi:hypothetical protein
MEGSKRDRRVGSGNWKLESETLNVVQLAEKINRVRDGSGLKAFGQLLKTGLAKGQ